MVRNSVPTNGENVPIIPEIAELNPNPHLQWIIMKTEEK